MMVRWEPLSFDGVKSDAQGNYSATFRVPNDPSSNVLIIVAGYGKNVTNRSRP